MKNIKTLFKLMTAVILTTVSTGSLIACQSDDILKINMQVQKDFNFLDSNNNSTIKLDIYQNNITKLTKWNSIQLNNITASNLLENDSETTKAKSADAANFLVDILKLKAVSGQGKYRLFKHSDTQSIKMKVKSYSPIINKKIDHTDYIITGGTVTIFFLKNNKQLSDNYLLNILSKPNDGLVLPKLPTTSNVSLNNFNDIPEFKIGQPKSKLLVDTDLTNYLKSPIYSLGERIADLMKQGDHFKVKVSKSVNDGTYFAKGDVIKVKFSIGEIQFNSEYTLTII
ncbi:MAG: hypothetical protein H9Q65_01840 [Spiroplasma ixodetis]|nr:hypothetical protein [Spiroplasma ixodetis]MBP1527986.1 hypothetical protein [Spiroplasma ixodetis]